MFCLMRGNRLVFLVFLPCFLCSTPASLSPAHLDELYRILSAFVLFVLEIYQQSSDVNRILPSYILRQNPYKVQIDAFNFLK